MNLAELQNRLKNFAYRIVAVCEALPKKKIARVIEDQVLRSAFSAAANYKASCNAISSIAFEESDESLFWLETIVDLKLINENKMMGILQKAKQLSNILSAQKKPLKSSLNFNLKYHILNINRV